MTRRSSSRIWFGSSALLTVPLLLVACGGDGEVSEAPPGDVEAPPAKTAEKTKQPEKTGETATVRIVGSGKRRRPRIKTSFARERKEFQRGDVVKVHLRRGGETKGTITAIGNKLLLLSHDAIITRLTPREVTRVSLLYRPASKLGVIAGGGPRTPAESWLPRHVASQVLGRSATELWNGRYRKNIPLIVKREFRVVSHTFSRRSLKAYFKRGKRIRLRQYDQLKWLGAVDGYRWRKGRSVALGKLYLYLLRRNQKVWHLHSPSPLKVVDLDPRSVRRYVDKELVTRVVSRPGEQGVLSVKRITGRRARIARAHLERTPDRREMRRLRARSDEKQLARAEKQVRAMYAAMGLKKDTDLDRPLAIELWVPKAEGTIDLVAYRREIGLD